MSRFPMNILNYDTDTDEDTDSSSDDEFDLYIGPYPGVDPVSNVIASKTFYENAGKDIGMHLENEFPFPIHKYEDEEETSSSDDESDMENSGYNALIFTKNSQDF